MEPEITAGRAGGVVDDAALQVDRAVVIEAREQGLGHRQRIARLERRIEAEVKVHALQPVRAGSLELRGCAGQASVQQLAARHQRIIARSRRLQRRRGRLREQSHERDLGGVGAARNARAREGKEPGYDPRDTG